MPELPDITVYVEALEARILDQPLEKIRLRSPFLLRSVEPPLNGALGRKVVQLRRLGKRIVIGVEGGLFLVLHLMIAGRLHWKEPAAKLHGKIGQAAFDFPNGSLTLTEAGTKKRASLYVVRGEAGLAEHDPGGLEVMEGSPEEFARVLRLRNHTIKRALTDPRLFSGIGNAYSDEILHRARFSPFALTSKVSDEDAARLHGAIREVMKEWIARLREEAAGTFPEKVTAFREGMAVHGRYGKPCPVCGKPVQRVRFSGNELNYCAQCQNEGRLYSDRALSALLKKDWPKTLEELEQMMPARKAGG
jgi:formamidopyrimidine-DNA glycosylase